MKAGRLLFLLPLLALQSGCVLITSYSKGDERIDQWVKEKQYGNALKALNNIDPKDPDYLKAAEKRKQVEALAAAYEHDIRQHNNELLRQGKWAEALDSYDEAMDRLPDSVVLKDGLAQLHRDQSRELERLELERLLAHGNWLKQTLPTYRDIARVDPRSSNARNRLDAKQREAETVADELALHGNRALANNQLHQAEELLVLASELSNTPAIRESLKKLKQQKAVAARRARQKHEAQLRLEHAAEIKQRHTIDTLLKQFNATFNNKEYEKARIHLQSLAEANLETSHYRALQQKLNRAIDQEASRLFDIGVDAYSRGQFEVAAKQWRRVLALQPDNTQAQENLQRAERVLNKIQQLKEKQQGN